MSKYVDRLKAREAEYWYRYANAQAPASLPLDPNVSAAFAGNAEITDSLLALYLAGKKCAGSGIVEDYLSAGDPLPQVGNYWIYLDSRDEPRCILLTERVVFHKFKDIPKEIAVAEGEGDLSVAYWKEAHGKFYSPHLEAWGVPSLDEATVVTEYFKIVLR